MTTPSITPAESPPMLGGDGSTFGMRSATWSNIRKALRRLGAAPERVTSKHTYLLYRMPTGTKISVGGANHARLEARGAPFGIVFTEVERAECPPILFAAVLAGLGCTWIVSQPDEIRRLSMFLLHDRPNLGTKDEWQKAMRTFRTRESRDAMRHVHPEPAATPPAAAPEEAPMTDRPATFSTGDVLALAGFTDEDTALKSRVAANLAHAVKQNAKWVQPYSITGDINAEPDPKYDGKRNRLTFTDKGVIAAAEAMLARYAPERLHVSATPAGNGDLSATLEEPVKQTSTGDAPPAPQTTTADPTPPSPTPGEQPLPPGFWDDATRPEAKIDHIDVKAAFRKSVPRHHDPKPFTAKEIGAAAIALCERLQISVPFFDDDPTSIDLRAILDHIDAVDLILGVINSDPA